MPVSTLLLHLSSICLIILGISANSVTLVIERNVLANLSAGFERGFCKNTWRANWRLSGFWCARCCLILLHLAHSICPTGISEPKSLSQVFLYVIEFVSFRYV